MKKFISAALSAAIVLSTAAVLPASAKTEHYGSEKKIMILGDSISAGYTLKETDYNYGQIVGDYLGYEVNNYAVTGTASADLVATLDSFSSEQNKQLSESDIVIITVGSNDIMRYSARYLLEYAADRNLLVDGYTAADIPAAPNFGDVTNMMSRTKISDFINDPDPDVATGHSLDMNSALLKLRAHLIYTDKNKNYQKYDRVIQTQIIPNIEAVVAKIHTANPDARIILQTIYDPMQLSDEYLQKNVDSGYRAALDQFSPKFKDILEGFGEQIKEINGVEIADVYEDFSSFEDKNREVGNAWYFTNMQRGTLDDMDIHPSQKGHLAIAATVLNTIGEKHEDGGLLNTVYIRSGASKEAYPSLALKSLNNVLGTYSLGDINNNGQIDSLDASMILAEYAALSTAKPGENASILTPEQSKAAHVLGNETLSPLDASAALNYYSYASTAKGNVKSLKRYRAEDNNS